MTGRVIGWTV
ncbi:Protein of unknown function [Bacillus toyonensis]|uniref:Uncharacterized protein n=2 Tax=Bacillus cereus group TaxID=86661 RepID=A0A1C4G414_BACTU|nr:Protein of unknown function [Bacillus wiedmannii]SCC62703.1 Protein of unknown function [Bacillus thuringiensis]SCN18612.1 Protein of unknown function [Bacillus toyonensis]SCN37212.1 Protein of unknown function [Bacillus cereus]